ncbi:hypothetical protein GX865_04950 [Candidatus Saccharibacteria bacterium]|nr:hypothetical protein [Candidatus Saccharibacteria bacterium]
MKEQWVYFLMGDADSNDPNIPAYSDLFLEELSQACGFRVANAPLEKVSQELLPVFFIASGGAEEGFKAAYQLVAPPYVLLTTPSYNSLAAAMEIMGFLDEQGLSGEILHGSAQRIARRLTVLSRAAVAEKTIDCMRLGAIGKPSGLIASEADPKVLKEATGMEVVDLDLMELVDEYKKGGYPENDWTRQLKAADFDVREVEQALDVYGASCRMIERYKLDAVTVRCFELLKHIDTTGCLALAILNAQGIPAACEGDTKSLVSMVILTAVTGQPSFMANPSSMDPDTGEIIFAHCTLPLDMPDRYRLTTHFETGIGVAVAGDLEPTLVTVMKCNESLSRWYVGTADLLESLGRPDLCRTQMRLKLHDGTHYFEHNPISNHHMICRGDWAEELEEFFKRLQKKLHRKP